MVTADIPMDDNDFTLGQQIAELRGVVITRMDGIANRVAELASHQKEINGTVAKHQIMLTDYENFKNATLEKAKHEVMKRSRITASITGIVSSIVTYITIRVVATLLRLTPPFDLL